MSNELLPGIDASGIWKLKAPYDTKLIPDLAYTCKAVRKLSEVVSSGTDVKADCYTAYEIPDTTYDEHVAADISIITLVSSSGNSLAVPSPYLDGWPSSDVVPYVVLGMLINLGAIPNTIDPTYLTDKVTNVISTTLGHVPTIEYLALSEVKNVAFDQHTALENLRQSNITDNNTDYIRRLNAEDELAKARAEIAALQQFIINSGVSVPTVPG